MTGLCPEMLAKAMGTNPVVVRRIRRMACATRVTYAPEKGHGGGWELARDLAGITLRDVYEALGRPALFAMGNCTGAAGLSVEQAVNAALDTAFRDAEALLMSRLGDVTLARLSADFHARLAARPRSRRTEIAHVHRRRRPGLPAHVFQS